MKLCNSEKKYLFYVLSTVLFVLFGFSSFSNPVIDKSLLPPPVISPAGPVTFCGRGALNVTGYLGNPNFQWLNGNTPIANSNNSTLSVTSSGTYYCIVIISNNNSDTTIGVNVTIKVADTVNVTTTDNSICNGQNTSLTATATTAGTIFLWSPVATLNSSTLATVTATPSATTLYSVIGTAPNGCKDTATISITVNPKPTSSFNFSPNNGCPRKRRKIYFNSTSTTNGSGNLNYSWNFGDPNSNNNTSNNNNPNHSFVGTGFNNPGNFLITLIECLPFNGLTTVK